MPTAAELIFKISQQGASELDKVATIVKTVGEGTRLTGAALKTFDSTLSGLVGTGKTVAQSLEQMAASSGVLSRSIRSTASELAGLDKQAQRTADEAEKSAKRQADAAEKSLERQQSAIQKLGRMQEQANAENKKRDEEANKLNPQAAGFGKGFAMSALGVGAIGGIGLAAGREAAEALGKTIASLTTEYAATARETVNFGERMDISAGQARKLENEARLLGISIHTLESSARITATALEDSEGAGKRAAAAFARLGIDTRGTFGEIREAGPVTLELIEKLSKITSETERTREGTAALGRGYKEIIPLVDQYGELQRVTESLGVNLETNVIEQAAKADEKFKELALSFDALRNSFAKGILPIVVTITESITRVVSGKPEGMWENVAWGAGKAASAIAEYNPFTQGIGDASDLASGALQLPGLLSGQAGFDNPDPASLYGASKNARYGPNGIAGDAGRAEVNAHYADEALSQYNDGKSLESRAHKARSEADKLAAGIEKDKEHYNPEQGQALEAAKNLADQLERQVKAQKEGVKTAREQAEEMKRISAAAAALSGKGDSPQQALILRMKELLESPGFKLLTNAQQIQGRADIVQGSAEGLSRLDAESAAKRAAKVQALGDKGQRENDAFANREIKYDAGTKGEEYSGPAGDILKELNALGGKDDVRGRRENPLSTLPHDQATSQDLIKSTEENARREEALARVQGDPRDKEAVEQQIASIRVKAVQDVLRYELNIAALKGPQAAQAEADARVAAASKIFDIEVQNQTRLAQLKDAQNAKDRAFASELANIAMSRNSSQGFRNFFRDQAHSLGAGVAGNLFGGLAGGALNNISQPLDAAGLGPLLKGTILDRDKGKAEEKIEKNTGDTANILREIASKLHIGAFADGGTVTSPTLALLGEAGTEHVLTDENLSSLSMGQVDVLPPWLRRIVGSVSKDKSRDQGGFGKDFLDGFPTDSTGIGQNVATNAGFIGAIKAALKLIPHFADGATVTGATLGLLGEAGIEHVVPDSKLSSLSTLMVAVADNTKRAADRLDAMAGVQPGTPATNAAPGAGAAGVLGIGASAGASILGRVLSGSSGGSGASGAGAIGGIIKQVLGVANSVSSLPPAGVTQTTSGSWGTLPGESSEGGPLTSPDAAMVAAGYPSSPSPQDATSLTYNTPSDYGSLASGGTTSGQPVDVATLQASGNATVTSSSGHTVQGVAGGIASAAGGAVQAYQGFSKGGVSGDLQGAGGALESAGAVIAMVGGPVGMVVGGVMAAVGAITGLVGSMLGTGPQQRANAIANELGQNQYQAPTAWNVSETGNGNYADIDARGNLRTSNFSAVPTVAEPYETTNVINGQRSYYSVPGNTLKPFSGEAQGTGQAPVSNAPTVIIQAMDSQSFSDFAQKNEQAFGKAVTTHLQTNGEQLAAAIRYHTNG